MLVGHDLLHWAWETYLNPVLVLGRIARSLSLSLYEGAEPQPSTA